MTDIPNIICLEGVGKFYSDGLSFNAPFSLIQYPAQTKIIVKINTGLKQNDKNWKLKGFLDNKRPIKCDHLSRSLIIQKGIEQYCEFMPFNTDIIIGNKLNKPIKDAYYPLVSYFEQTLALSDDGWKIEITNSHNNLEQIKSIAKNWKIPIEGLILHLSHPDATIDQYREKARQIVILLSLACGNEVTFDRQIISWETPNDVEIWRRMKGGEYGTGVCVLDILEYLRETLPIWKTFSGKEQNNIQLAITYINLSANGYMDDKLLRITQAWEMLANAWGNQITELKDSIKELRKELKEVYKKWRKKYSKEDPNGFLGKRITDALEWDQALKKMEQLAYSYKINTKKIALYFSQLIDVRDSVAHIGIMPVEVRNDKESPPFKLLIAAQFGLKILLLKKLGYSGLIATSENGWLTYEKISEYLMQD